MLFVIAVTVIAPVGNITASHEEKIVKGVEGFSNEALSEMHGS